MQSNQTMGSADVMPELTYPDVGAAIDWLCETFGFHEIWRVGNHRARVGYGNGIVIIADAQYGRNALDGPARTHSVMVRVADAHAHHAHAKECGATILSGPTDHAYGERQYSVEDLGGHHWTFSQTIADVAPEEWGGTSAG